MCLTVPVPHSNIPPRKLRQSALPAPSANGSVMNAAARNKVINRLEVAAHRTRLLSKPVVVDVVLTKACNFACTFCKDYETEGARRISLTNFERMAAQLLPTASRLSICSGGEPYLHTGLEDILRIARK